MTQISFAYILATICGIIFTYLVSLYVEWARTYVNMFRLIAFSILTLQIICVFLASDDHALELLVSAFLAGTLGISIQIFSLGYVSEVSFPMEPSLALGLWLAS
jgi:hypothetical protein